MPVLLSSLAQVGGNTAAQAPHGYPDQEAQFCSPQVASSRQSASPPPHPGPPAWNREGMGWGGWGFLLQPFPSHGEETSGKDSQAHCSFDPSCKILGAQRKLQPFHFLIHKAR